MALGGDETGRNNGSRSVLVGSSTVVLDGDSRRASGDVVPGGPSFPREHGAFSGGVAIADSQQFYSRGMSWALNSARSSSTAHVSGKTSVLAGKSLVDGHRYLQTLGPTRNYHGDLGSSHQREVLEAGLWRVPDGCGVAAQPTLDRAREGREDLGTRYLRTPMGDKSRRIKLCL